MKTKAGALVAMGKSNLAWMAVKRIQANLKQHKNKVDKVDESEIYSEHPQVCPDS